MGLTLVRRIAELPSPYRRRQAPGCRSYPSPRLTLILRACRRSKRPTQVIAILTRCQ
jgi:hypothetical protein